MRKNYILFAEDDPDDQDMIRECCRELSYPGEIFFTGSGDELLRELQAIRDPAQYPALIVLDINMPRMNGAETLLQLKRNDRFRHIPVVMYSTTSRSPEYYVADLGAAQFYRKPASFDQYKYCVQQILSLCTGAEQSRAQA